MINLMYITAKAMPAAQAAAGQRASMLISAVGGAIGGAVGKHAFRRCLQSAMFGKSSLASWGYAATGNGSNGFGYANPPFRDNSSGTARLKLK